jgi:hypothetical protein
MKRKKRHAPQAPQAPRMDPALLEKIRGDIERIVPLLHELVVKDGGTVQGTAMAMVRYAAIAVRAVGGDERAFRDLVTAAWNAAVLDDESKATETTDEKPVLS